MKHKAVIFDMDGVIVDTPKLHFSAWRKLANEMGFDIDPQQNEKLKGVSRERCLEYVLSWGNKNASKEEFELLMKRKNKDFLKSVADMSEEDLLPGVRDVMENLREWNIPFALGSASKNSKFILKRLKIYDWFTAVVDGNDITRTKPDPEVFLMAAAKLQLEPQDCVVFEDAISGVEAAKAAGMTCIGIGERNVLKKADYTFADFTEINAVELRKILEGRFNNYIL